MPNDRATRYLFSLLPFLRFAGLLLALCFGPASTSVRADDHALRCAAPVQTAPSTPVASTAPSAGTSASAPSSGSGPSANPAKNDSGKIATDPLQFDLKLFSGNESATLSIQNDTSTEINEIDISSLGLLDGKTGRRVPFVSKTDQLNLKPHERTDCTFALPSSNFAGTHTGTLRVQGAGREALVPLTLRTRGPLLTCWNGFPLTILTAVFLIGWGLSLILDRWYSTGLPRVQQVLLLREQQTAMSNFLTQLSSWEKNYKSGLPKTAAVVAFDKSDLDAVLIQVNSTPLLELQQDEQRFSLGCRLNDELWTALQIAGLKVPSQALPTVVGQLDGLARGTDPSSYRAALLQILTSPLPSGAAIALGQTAAGITGIDLSKTTSAKLRERILAMDFVKAFVLAIATWITAFSVYYYSNPSFGGVLDYLTVFVWALGLTTTGSQLISSIRKP
jgi:hypothetical protein